MKVLYIITLLIMAIGMLAAQSPWQTASAAGLSFEYRVNAEATHLEGILNGETTGWIAVGFNPTSVMRNANIIIGYVSGGTGFVRDDWGTSNTSHAADTSMGGTSDVLLISSSELDGITSLHFNIPLDSGDQYDGALQIGSSYPIILARGANNADNYTGMHAAAGYAEIHLLAPVSLNDPGLVTKVSDRILSIYPHPMHRSANIRFISKNGGNTGLYIYNARGQKVYEKQFIAVPGEQDVRMETPSLAAGIYLLKSKSASGSATGKLSISGI